VLLDVASPVMMLALLVIASVPSLFLGTLLSTVGRFTAGVCIFSGALVVLVYWAGSGSGWINRAQLPGDYWLLVLETLLWQLFVLIAIILMYQFRPMVFSTLPQLLKEGQSWKTTLKIPVKDEIVAAVISTFIAAVMCFLLVRNASSKQVLWSVFVSFVVSAGIGQSVKTNTNPIAIYLSPGLVAIISYLMVILFYSDSTQVHSALFAGSEPGISLMNQFPGSALVLPAQYLSAGILGCSIGIGIVRAATDEQSHGVLAPVSVD
jgi:hypothetical protein